MRSIGDKNLELQRVIFDNLSHAHYTGAERNRIIICNSTILIAYAAGNFKIRPMKVG